MHFLFFILTFFNVCFATESPEALLKKAEYIRNPQIDYEVWVNLTDSKKGKIENRSYKASLKGTTKSLVDFITPEVDRGTKVLMVEEQMWINMPGSAKPIRISPKQKLVGNAAYGDITRLNFTGNYTVKIKGSEKFKGRNALVLDLVAIENKPVTYDKVEYWIDASNHEPLKTLYMTASGKVLREGFFEGFENVLGVRRPTIFLLVDHLETNHVTKLVFSKAKKADLPDLLFERQNFGRG